MSNVNFEKITLGEQRNKALLKVEEYTRNKEAIKRRVYGDENIFNNYVYDRYDKDGKALIVVPVYENVMRGEELIGRRIKRYLYSEISSNEEMRLTTILVEG